MIFRAFIDTLNACRIFHALFCTILIYFVQHTHRTSPIGRHRLPPSICPDPRLFLVPAHPHPLRLSLISKPWAAIKSTLMKFSQIKATMTLPLQSTTHLPNAHEWPPLLPLTPPSQPPSSPTALQKLVHPHSHPSKPLPPSVHPPLEAPFAPSTLTAPTINTHVNMYIQPRESCLNLTTTLQARVRDTLILDLQDVEEVPLCQHMSQA